MCDAAPQWSLNAIQRVKKNIGKPIPYVFPTHHHRDHSGGVPDYVAAGAKLTVPEMSRDYWANIRDAEIITFK
ncbi:uncharacterized protein A1O9_04178 [Exophiala aquamarina CBS 119918]|uniref:Metallo-beta-lactamase domain-containing protein n=1 Tax=Exophiala aquamarina CBS 119918 TaxID=1182545 RepID=A0A072PGW2_9EURO|nr:uncharacterized protein A1O9_04178 [Exophiala aquamarina CBS 119918]KEF59334.1 hypothetical protein A1O9_04178 [Exophiala aquamarina CBS 119918]